MSMIRVTNPGRAGHLHHAQIHVNSTFFVTLTENQRKNPTGDNIEDILNQIKDQLRAELQGQPDA